MKRSSFDKIRELRKKRNQHLLERMRGGDNLQSFDSEWSWYPKRPTIEKDRTAIARLYQGKKDKPMLPKKPDGTDAPIEHMETSGTEDAS